MRVVADENMPALDLWREAGHDVTPLPGRAISRANLQAADVLLVRSVTRVDGALLEGSPVRFVGSATSGTDHIDIEALQGLDIAFANAPGANAQSVVDYVFSILAVLNAERGLDWLQASVGIVGGGQIGGRLCRQLHALGVRVRVCDPFLDEHSPVAPWLSSLRNVLACDVVTIHTPLTRSGSFPTWHLVDGSTFDTLRKEQVLINAARGGVVDEAELLDRMKEDTAPLTVLDVWEGEPDYSRELARRVMLATPHIAGYSLEGKTRGTVMLLDAFRQLEEGPTGSRKREGSDLPLTPLVLGARDACKSLSDLILQAYDVRKDAGRFATNHSLDDPGAGFDRQRKNYLERHEFSAYAVEGVERFPALRPGLQALGFRLP